MCGATLLSRDLVGKDLKLTVEDGKNELKNQSEPKLFVSGLATTWKWQTVKSQRSEDASVLKKNPQTVPSTGSFPLAKEGTIKPGMVGFGVEEPDWPGPDPTPLGWIRGEAAAAGGEPGLHRQHQCLWMDGPKLG